MEYEFGFELVNFKDTKVVQKMQQRKDIENGVAKYSLKPDHSWTEFLA